MRAIERHYRIPLYFTMMTKIYFYIRQLLFDYSPRGQGLVEYALLILLVGLAVILMLTTFGAAVGNMFSGLIGLL